MRLTKKSSNYDTEHPFDPFRKYEIINDVGSIDKIISILNRLSEALK